MARRIAANLARAAQFTETNTILALVVAQREHASALTAASATMVDSFQEGGLDHLWTQKDRLGLPQSVTRSWQRVPPYPNPDAHPAPGLEAAPVHPARIPARDQVLVYAAQINASFQREFRAHLRTELGGDAERAFARASRIGRLVWQAYAFLAPGGRAYDPAVTLAAQANQGFGCRTALQYVVRRTRATDPRAEVDLDLVYKDPALNVSAWVKSAKIRVVETLFLERLLTTVRELVVVNG